jgi:hypothetical protein
MKSYSVKELTQALGSKYGTGMEVVQGPESVKVTR